MPDAPLAWQVASVRLRRRAALYVLAVLALALAPLARGPWQGSEQLVANAESPRWSRRLALWSTDAARIGDEPAAWYSSTASVARRYVRLAPSALMSLEIAVFGTRPWALRLVTLALHVVVCWLGLRLLARWTGDVEKAAAVVLVVGLHGAAFEVVSWESCQPIAVAALFSLLAASLVLASRDAGSSRATLAAGALLLTVFAMTSYEAAVALPLALLQVERAPRREGSSGPPARAPAWLAPTLLGLYPVYALVVWISTRGSTHASYRAAPSEALATLAGDLAGYLTRTVLYFFIGDGAIAHLRYVVAGLAVAALATTALSRARPTSLRRGLLVGTGAYFLFLAPPLFTRATVSLLNRPSHRQLYLPLAGVAILLALAPGRMTIRRWIVMGAVAGLAATASVAILVRRAPPPGYERLRASVRRALADARADQPVLVVGRAICPGRFSTHEYHVEYDAGPRPVVQFLPLDRSGRLPALRLTGERTIEVRAEAGFAFDSPPRAATTGRIPHRPPPIASAREQRASFGRVEVVTRDTRLGIRELLITLDRPAAEHVLLLLDGCAEARRVELGAAAALAPDALDSARSSAQAQPPTTSRLVRFGS